VWLLLRHTVCAPQRRGVRGCAPACLLFLHCCVYLEFSVSSASDKDAGSAALRVRQGRGQRLSDAEATSIYRPRDSHASCGHGRADRARSARVTEHNNWISFALRFFRPSLCLTGNRGSDDDRPFIVLAETKTERLGLTQLTQRVGVLGTSLAGRPCWFSAASDAHRGAGVRRPC
jgi:hypothetical protein